MQVIGYIAETNEHYQCMCQELKCVSRMFNVRRRVEDDGPMQENFTWVVFTLLRKKQ